MHSSSTSRGLIARRRRNRIAKRPDFPQTWPGHHAGKTPSAKRIQFPIWATPFSALGGCVPGGFPAAWGPCPWSLLGPARAPWLAPWASWAPLAPWLAPWLSPWLASPGPSHTPPFSPSSLLSSRTLFCLVVALHPSTTRGALTRAKPRRQQKTPSQGGQGGRLTGGWGRERDHHHPQDAAHTAVPVPGLHKGRRPLLPTTHSPRTAAPALGQPGRNAAARGGRGRAGSRHVRATESTEEESRAHTRTHAHTYLRTRTRQSEGGQRAGWRVGTLR